MSHDDSVYDGLLTESEGWAFGTSFEDPLAGVDLTVPDGVDPRELGAYALLLGDDALVLSQRLIEWCSNAPDLEDDIALANIALDLLGQARLLLARAAAADPGDFGETIARLLVFSCHRLALLQRLTASRDQVLAAIAAKGVKEVTYHRDYAARWFVTLAQGTEESRRRVVAGLEAVMAFHDELFEGSAEELAAERQGLGPDPQSLAGEVGAVVDQVLAVAEVERPVVTQVGRAAGCAGREGRHTEALSRMLAEMQVVARAHPLGLW
jgi:ring-1,2-phenylacetyl-CoA epoxidase subunit PaaC